MPEQRFVTTLRLPRELQGYIADTAAQSKVSFNARVVAMLAASRDLEENNTVYVEDSMTPEPEPVNAQAAQAEAEQAVRTPPKAPKPKSGLLVPGATGGFNPAASGLVVPKSTFKPDPK